MFKVPLRRLCQKTVIIGAVCGELFSKEGELPNQSQEVIDNTRVARVSATQKPPSPTNHLHHVWSLDSMRLLEII